MTSSHEIFKSKFLRKSVVIGYRQWSDIPEFADFYLYVVENNEFSNPWKF